MKITLSSCRKCLYGQKLVSHAQRKFPYNVSFRFRDDNEHTEFAEVLSEILSLMYSAMLYFLSILYFCLFAACVTTRKSMRLWIM